MKIGVFGGSFNPVHNGHINFAREIYSRAKLDKIIFVPAFISPLKSTVLASKTDRLKMLELALENESKFEISDFELKNEKTSYTYYTIEHFKSLYPNDELYLIIGSDQLLNFDKWFRFEDILKSVSILSCSRINKVSRKELYDFSKQRLNISEDKIFIADFEPYEVSSSEIRIMIKNGENIEGLVPKSVSDYIKERGLYLDI